MQKNALYYLTPHILAEPLPFKKLSLLFDKIYIRDKIISPEIEQYNKPEFFNTHGTFWQRVFKNMDEIEYLKELDIIETYNPDYSFGLVGNEKEDLKNVIDQISPELKKALTVGFPDISSGSAIEGVFAESANMSARIETLMLQSNYSIDCIPILFSNDNTSKQVQKETVFQFLLNEIPEPDITVSWEQITDFRSDEDTRLKYLALVNWVNDISRSPLSWNEIIEKYEYLYLEYKRAYERHKMKSTFNILEILIATGTSLVSGNIPFASNAVSTFFKISLSKMNLIQEEKNLLGKEIAYIFHTNHKFSS